MKFTISSMQVPKMSQDSSVCIVTYYKLLNFWQWQGLFSLCHHIQTSKPSLLSNGYQGLFPWELGGQSMKLTTHLHPVLSLRMCVKLYFHSAMCLLGMVPKLRGQLLPFQVSTTYGTSIMNIISLFQYCGIYDGKLWQTIFLDH